LIVWQKVNAKFADAQYDRYNFPKTAVRQSLLAEQGGICAYTMIRIDDSCCHIEHLKPQKICRDEGNLAQTADYKNMVACYPKEHVAGEPLVPFGAIYRQSKWDSSKFISPLSGNCEAAFQFRMSGEVDARPASNGNAQWMIQTLGLGVRELSALRRAAIEEIGVSLVAEEPLSAREAKQLLANICDGDRQGRFRPYCVAIKHAAEEYLRLLGQKAKRNRYIRASRARRRK
jgi:uncharacterized protein (TIGR02646 family)